MKQRFLLLMLFALLIPLGVCADRQTFSVFGKSPMRTYVGQKKLLSITCDNQVGEMEYDSNGRITKYTYNNGGNTPVVYSYSYGSDKVSVTSSQDASQIECTVSGGRIVSRVQRQITMILPILKVS